MFSVFIVALTAATPEPNCKDPKTQVEMNVCADRSYLASDVEMVRQYQLLAARMKQMDTDTPGSSAALLNSQRAWLKFRDVQCRYEGYLVRGGTAEPLMVSGCLDELTKERTKTLMSLLEGFGS